MSNIMTNSYPIQLKKTIPTVLIDGFAIAFIYFVPAISHMLNFPLYLIEPMRIMVILAMIYTSRYNALILAATLPFMSYFISAHPVFVKSGLISIELVINVLLFFLINKKAHMLVAIFSSIWISKLIYYGMKYITILWLYPNDRLISTPLYIQLITSLVLSAFLFLALYHKNEKHFK